MRKTAQEASNRHSALQAREAQSDALMRPGSEGEMPVGGSCQVEPVRMLELFRIPVGRADTQVQLSAGRQPGFAQLRVGRGAPIAQLIRAFEAQDLLDGGPGEIRVREQRAALIRPVDQQLHAVADEVGRGLVARVQDENAIVQEFGLAERGAAVFIGEQARQHVARRILRDAPPVGNQSLEIMQEVPHRLVAGLQHARARRRLQCAQDGERPAAQRPPIAARNAEQIADDLDGNGRGEVGDHIATARRLDAVQQPLHRRDQSVLQIGDGLRRQRAGDDPANPGMQGRVVEHQAGGVVLIERRIAELGLELDSLVRAERRGIAVDALQISVAREEVAAVGQFEHRRLGAQGRIHRIRILVKGSRQRPQIEVTDVHVDRHNYGIRPSGV